MQNNKLKSKDKNGKVKNNQEEKNKPKIIIKMKNKNKNNKNKKQNLKMKIIRMEMMMIRILMCLKIQNINRFLIFYLIKQMDLLHITNILRSDNNWILQSKEIIFGQKKLLKIKHYQKKIFKGIWLELLQL